MLVQLLYISLHEGKTIENMDAFMAAARARNKKVGISSILLGTEKYYIHLIEGRRVNVNELYSRISNDPKHSNCTLIRYVDVKAREFSEWSAEYVAFSEFDAGDMNLLLPAGIIDINTITSAKAVTMLRRIHAHLLVTADKHKKAAEFLD